MKYEKKFCKKLKRMNYNSKIRKILVCLYKERLILFTSADVKKQAKTIINKYIVNCPNLKNNRKLLKNLLYYRKMYNILFREYFMYHFFEISEKESENYITCNSRKKYLRVLNAPIMGVTKNKFKCYLDYKEFYKRDAEQLINKKDYNKFEKFVIKHPVFVKKPISALGGRGVELIDSKGKNLKNLFNDILEDTEGFIVEEQIIQDKRLAKIHPESVNCVRICVYVDEHGDARVHRPFFKVGQGDSFVDNGGAGGILALIDEKTGKIISNGMDELIKEFDVHPDSKVKFKGFQIPKWKELLDLAQKISKVHPDGRYIGWDVALSNKGWVIVEGNNFTGFIGQQMPGRIGLKKELEELIDWENLKK